MTGTSFKPAPPPRPIPRLANWALALHRFHQNLRRADGYVRHLAYHRYLFGGMGHGSRITKPMMLMHPDRFFLGKDVRIRDGARLEAVRQFKDRIFNPVVTIGDGSRFEQGLHLVCAESVTIGKRVQVTEYVGIFDIWHPYEDVSTAVMDQMYRTAPVSIGDNSLIGMGAVIQPGVAIGRHCVIGANSVVTKDIPDYSIAAGQPAKVIKHFDQHTIRWVRGPRGP